jgi:hypothetical protein
LNSDDASLMNSFVSVCGYLSLNPEAVRSRVRALTEGEARRLRGMEFGDEW